MASTRPLSARTGGWHTDTADRAWDGDVAHASAAQVLEVTGADHGLGFGSSVDPSLEALWLDTHRIASFVDALATTRG
jgi:hypothetical protein